MGGVCLVAAGDAPGLPSSRFIVGGSLIRRSTRRSAEPIQAIRLPANQSRLRAFRRGDLPAHHRQGPREVRPSHPSWPWLSRLLTSCLYFSWHAARRCYPRRPPPLFVALARPSEVSSRILARDPGPPEAGLFEWPMNRVASAEAGRQPFPPLSRSRRRREFNPAAPPEGGHDNREEASPDTKGVTRVATRPSGDERSALARVEVRRSHAPAKGRLFTSDRWCLPLRRPKLQRFNSREPGRGPARSALAVRGGADVREPERGARFRRPRTSRTGCSPWSRKPRASRPSPSHVTQVLRCVSFERLDVPQNEIEYALRRADAQHLNA